MDDIKHISLADKVFMQLENEILSGKYKSGDILTEMKLSAEYGVSRTPVREAIRRLQQENLVMESGKGIVVIGISLKDLSDIYDIRIRLEGLACRWAAEKITEEQLKKIHNTLELQEFYTIKNRAENIKDMDTNFHTAIYSCCGSDTLMEILTMLHRKIQMYRKFSVETSARAKKSYEEHSQIYKALCARDGELTEKLVIRHLQNAKENLLSALNAKGDINGINDSTKNN